jgi:hypothetical protein
MEENKNLEINLKMLLNMNEQSVDVTKITISESEKLTFREKTMKYLSAQIGAKMEKMKRYETNISDADLPNEFIAKREQTRSEYDTLVETKMTLEML